MAVSRWICRLGHLTPKFNVLPCVQHSFEFVSQLNRRSGGFCRWVLHRLWGGINSRTALKLRDGRVEVLAGRHHSIYSNCVVITAVRLKPLLQVLTTPK